MSYVCPHTHKRVGTSTCARTHTHRHTHTNTSRSPSLWKEPAGSSRSLSCPLLPLLFSPPSPTVVFWTSNQEPLFLSLSLYDSLLIPHSQRAFFNTQCTNPARAILCACARRERERECEIGKRRAQRKEIEGACVETEPCLHERHPTRTPFFR